MAIIKIFATGVTGYIGGDALTEIIHTYPDWQYTLLVRDSDKGAKAAARWPSVRLVYGDFDSIELMEKEAEAADVVLHFANADSVSAATALTTGLSRRITPGHLIHTSGTGILCFHDMDIDSYGNPPTYPPYSDGDSASLSSVLNLPSHALHRNVDSIILAAGASGKVKTAIVCPPTIVGTGRGVDNTRSQQIPKLAAAFLERGQPFQIAKGLNRWTYVHVSDLSRLYLLLVTAAAGVIASGSSGPANAGKATWNDEGYYFAEAGEFEWGAVSRQLATKGKELEYWNTDTVEELPAVVANSFSRGAGVSWGTNSLCKAVRASELLGWEPTGPGLEASVEEALEVERKRAGIGHAKKAAGDA